MFDIMLGSKKISVVRQGLMLYSESPNDRAWQTIMQMSQREGLHQDIRTQLNSLMVTLLCSDKTSDSAGIWTVLQSAH